MSWLGLLVGVFSCCSVMYSHKMKSGLDFRFIISGGTIMTIINAVKGCMVGTGVFGNWYKNEQEQREK